LVILHETLKIRVQQKKRSQKAPKIQHLHK